MKLKGYSALIYEVPLTSTEAFWHACANVPYTPRYLVPAYDECTPNGRYYFLNPKHWTWNR